jgi:Major Facilitator Superfamily
VDPALQRSTTAGAGASLARVRVALPPPALRRILTAYTINRLGSWVGLVALSLAVFDHTHSALAVAALLLAWQALPAFLVPVLVARVEASKRRGALSGLYFFEAAATAALAVLLWHFSLPALLLLAALDGTAALAANSLLRSEVARVAREQVTGADGAAGERESRDAAAHEAERRANAAMNVAFSVSFVTGPALAGAVVAGAGAATALFIDVGTFLVCGALLFDLYPHVEEAAGESIRARLRAALAHINAVPSLRALLLVDAVALVLVQAGGPIEVAYVKSTLHGGDGGYGLLVTAWGAGAVLASVVFAGSTRRPLRVMLSSGIFALGVAFLGYAVAPSLALACAAAFIGGAGNGLDWPSLISLVQRLTPKHLHGRMMGATESIGALTLAVGLPLGGALVALSSPRAAFLILGVGTLVSAAALVRLTVMVGPEPAGEESVEAQAVDAQAVEAMPLDAPPTHSQPIRAPALLPREPSPE